jgi:hypothetical protein
MTRWDAELQLEYSRRKKAEYNRTYRLRHPERERACQPLYWTRWSARQRGLKPPPLPDWDKEPAAFEVHFRPGPRPGSTFRPRRKIPSWSAKQKFYNTPCHESSRLLPKQTLKERAEQAVNKCSARVNRLNKCSTMVRTREVGHIFCQCLICGRSFRVFKSEARRGEGKFCSIGCRDASRHLFRFALATDRLEPIMRELAAALKADITS